MQIGEYLATIRIGKNRRKSSPSMSLAALSEKCGVHASQINRIERGANRPTVFSLVRICAALRISLAELIIGIDGPLSVIGHSEKRQASSGERYLNQNDILNFMSKYNDDQSRQACLVDVGPAESDLPDYKKFSVLPCSLDQDEIYDVYIENGALTNFDLGQMIMNIRENEGLTRYGVESEIKFDYESLGRIEQGINSRLIFEDFIKLDKALNANGKLVAICWSVAEFETGIVSGHFVRQSRGNEEWTTDDTDLAIKLISISRWYQAIETEKPGCYSEWLRKFRDLVEK